MRRWAVLLAIVGCDSSTDVAAPPRAWVVSPALAAWPLGTATGTIGRSQAPQLALGDGIVAPGDVALAPLRLPTPWAVPGDGPARAIVYGTVDGKQAIELVDIDAGRVVWRDTTGCAAPVVGVTAEVVVCADARGTRAVGLDGKPRWSENGATFVAMTDDHVVIAGVGEVVIRDAELGDEIARVKLPSMPGERGRAPVRGQRPAPPELVPIAPDSIIASCGDAGRELFAYGQDGMLVRVVEGQGGPKVAWAVPLDTIASIDACEGTTVLVTVSASDGAALVALTRDTGKVAGTIRDVRGVWPARDGSELLEVSTGAGVARWSRELVAPIDSVPLPALGELLAKRRDMRLVRATPLTAVVLDAAGVAAYLPLSQLGAVLGDRAIVAATWAGSPGETVHRIPLPARYRRVLRVAGPRPPVMVPAELRDLPPIVELDPSTAIDQPNAGRYAVAAIALDRHDARDASVLYAAAQDTAPDDSATAGLARFDARARAWTWHRADGCGPGSVVGLAIARELVACAARTSKRASVRTTAHDGTPRWEWTGDNVDAITAAGDVIVAHDADRLVVLDARDGRVLAAAASDDGAAMRAAALDVDGMTLLVTAERDRVVARLPRANFAPAWSLDIAGVVSLLSPAGDGVLVALENGDAYRVDARTGATVALPGLDLVWAASDDLVTGEAPGGPIPPPLPYLPPPPNVAVRRGPVPERDPDAPPILPKTWPPPPPLPPSWQLTLYEQGGALRARNDYALDAPITPARVRGAGAPLLVQTAPGLRDVLVLDAKTGDPLRRVRLPEDAAAGMTFSTVVDGKPIVGTLLANPLRVVLF